MTSFLLQFFEFFTLGTLKIFLVFFIYSWLIWISKLISSYLFSNRYVQEYMTTFSVIVPVYKENPVVFEACLKSIRETIPNQFIVAVDGGNEEMITIAKKYADKVLSLPKVGKRGAMLSASKHLDKDNEVTIVVDSDTIWTDTTLHLLRPFQDAAIGGVTGRHRIFNEHDTISRLVADWLEQIRFDLVIPAQALYRRVLCLPGRTMAFRTPVFLAAIPKVANKKLLGVDIIVGDDRDLTTETLLQGYKTTYVPSSVVFTDCPSTLQQLSLQQLRWYRSVTRETFHNLWFYLRKAPMQLIWSLDFILSPALLSGILAGELFKRSFNVYEFMPFAYILNTTNKVLILSLLTAIGFFGTYYVRQLPHLIRRPSFTWYVPLFVLSTWIWIFPVKILTLFTMLEQGWNTRAGAYALEKWNIARARALSMFGGLFLFVPLFLIGFYNDLLITGLSFSQLLRTPFWQAYTIQLFDTDQLVTLQNIFFGILIVGTIIAAINISTHHEAHHTIRPIQLKAISSLGVFLVLVGVFVFVSGIQPSTAALQQVAGAREIASQDGSQIYQGQFVEFRNNTYLIRDVAAAPRLITQEILEIESLRGENSFTDDERIDISRYIRNEMAQARREGQSEFRITETQLLQVVN